MLRRVLDRIFSQSRTSTIRKSRRVGLDPRRMFLESLENRSLLAALATDAPDYAPGSDVLFSGSGYAQGETIELSISSDTSATQTFTIVDGGDGDGDGAADGNFSYLWNVGYDNVGATLTDRKSTRLNSS